MLFGTRNYTAGAEIQLPRKIPLRIEPKTYFGATRVGSPIARWALARWGGGAGGRA